jgi:hypothetical protein
MKSRILALPLALILALGASPLALAQTASAQQPATSTGVQDWQRLRDLKHGKKILIEFKDGNTIEGKFDGVIGSTLSLSADGTVYSLAQRDIQSAYRLKGRWSRKITASIGVCAGLVVGTIIGGKRMTKLERDPNRIPSDADEIPMITGMSLGALAGGGLGALLGGKRKGELLYEAK